MGVGAVGTVLGRLFAVVSVLGSAGCERRHAVIIGFAFGERHPNVMDVVHAEFARRPGQVEPQLVEPAALETLEGAPGAVTVADRLTAVRGIIGVVGHYDSRGSLAAAPVYDEAHIPLLVPTGTSRRLRDVSPWVFMMVPDDSVESAFIADFATRSLHARVAAVFYDNDEYGIGLRDGLRAAFAARGVTVAAEEPIASPCGSAELGEGSIVRATASRRPDLAVIAGRTRDAACLGRRVAERVPGIRIIGADAVEPDSTLRDRLAGRKGTDAIQFFTVALWHPAAFGPSSQSFARQFDSVVGVPPHASQALVYDAIMLLARAAQDAGPSAAAVRQYLTELGTTRPAYAGVTGPVAFGPGAHRPLFMLRVAADGSPPVVVQ